MFTCKMPMISEAASHLGITYEYKNNIMFL